ncbi:hypothetical protein ACWKW1_12165 [Brevibacillus parabrevis]|nr:hypothetical protein EN829_045725 [Mesorhizobium sp. M00.F.Ca.ET.186.01.1.1]
MMYVLGILAVCTLAAVLLYAKKGKQSHEETHLIADEGNPHTNHVNKAYHTGSLDLMGNSMNG